MELHIKNAMNDNIIKQASVYFDTNIESIKHVGGFENFIYEFSQNGSDIILRFVHSTHRSFDFVLAELEFIDYLSKNGANVSTVIPNNQGQISFTIDTENGEYFTVSAFSKAPGTYIKKEQVDESFSMMFGEAVGKLHRLSKTYQPQHKRYNWNEENILDLAEKHIPKELHFVVDKTKDIIQKIEAYGQDESNYGLIHTDLHFGNMYYDGTTLTFFDFDDSAYKHFISDIAIILFYQFAISPDEDEVVLRKMLTFLHPFLNGYNLEHSLDMIWFERINDYFKLRELILIIVIYAAGEEMRTSGFGQFYLNKFLQRAENDVPLVDIEMFINGIR